MALLAPDEGEVAMLDNIFRGAANENLELHLYSNNYDAVEGSTAANFTDITTNGGAAKTLTAGSWNAASTAAGVSSKTYAAQVFTFTGPVTVVGYFIKGATSGKVYWAERLYAATGQAFANTDTLTITPKLELA